MLAAPSATAEHPVGGKSPLKFLGTSVRTDVDEPHPSTNHVTDKPCLLRRPSAVLLEVGPDDRVVSPNVERTDVGLGGYRVFQGRHPPAVLLCGGR